MKLSRGNRKLKQGYLIWNLPAVKTCPGSTAICRKLCYARKAERVYPDVLPCRMSNYHDSKKESFTDDMIMLIEKTLKTYKKFNGYFRVHESGDFYNQKYLDSWFKIVAQFPEIKFLAFTKSFHLDFTGKPANLTIVNSIMPDTTLTPVNGYPMAYAGNCSDMVTAKTLECPGGCDNCGMCWDLPKLKRNVHFNIH